MWKMHPERRSRFPHGICEELCQRDSTYMGHMVNNETSKLQKCCSKILMKYKNVVQTILHWVQHEKYTFCSIGVA